jgi:glycosyltransferase involved in cell wall biosynthesis
MGKIRILEFVNHWGLGGVERTAELFCKYLDRSRFEVFAGAWGGGTREGRVRALTADMVVDPSPRALAAWIRERGIDIVHFHRSGFPDRKLLRCLIDSGVPVLIEHNIFANVDPSREGRRVARHLFVSGRQVEIYRERAGVLFEKEKCGFIYNPVETGIYDAFPFDRDYAAPVFGRYSRSDDSKWHPINILCLPYVRKAIPEARFLVIGMTDKYRALAREQGVLDMITEHPASVDERELCAFLNRITVFTHGSICGESFGMAMAEGMASGLPVITHTGGDQGQEEVVDDGINGYVVDPQDPRAYAEKLIHLLAHPEEKRRLGLAARDKARAQFAAEKVVKELESVFEAEYLKQQSRPSAPARSWWEGLKFWVRAGAA